MINKLLITILLFFFSCSTKDNLGQKLNKNDSDLINKIQEKYADKIKYSIKDNHVSCVDLIKMGELESFPDEIKQLSKLDSLHISKTSINNKKLDLRSIKGLKYLYLGHLNLDEYQLLFNENINEIVIYFCTFNKFPEAINNADLKKISFYTGEDYENILPKTLTYPNLEEIYFNGVDFGTYPDIISNKLIKLELHNTEILQELPKSYCKNKFETLQFSRCEKLSNLNGLLKNSQESLKNFEFVKMNDMATIPFDDLSKCKNLEKLRISGQYWNHMKDESVYDVFYGFKNLKTLIYRDLPVERILPEIKNLQKLEYLSFYGCYVKTVPKEIRDLPNLEALILTGTSVESLPAEMFDVDRVNKTRLEVDGGWGVIPEFLSEKDVERGYKIEE
ncbi:hypothetical protein KMW28_26720 [Flammeovirga yaeyamensis]|uniref:Leucine-rich repeat domain-containing protein n=2 Tax=Flammeovirga yaeyamensis TaxID=367791 RepID=A0AAX1NEW9_9BACT|nr:hypothetical protein [Flammeovirga yaeyamensis]MBB3701389.1 hypothetical protein [Flammeovirga yaeyamensis]QWG04493.1 hypothetical protein KMW28_26720 [Flammeovirga yaeyamensis]